MNEIRSDARDETGSAHRSARTGASLSIDTTFKVPNKATVVTSDGKRLHVINGGMPTVLNEKGQGIWWVSRL